MQHYDICLIGFGNVGKAFATLLDNKKQALAQQGLDFRITAIATGSHGNALNPEGIDPIRAIQAYQDNAIPALSSPKTNIESIKDFIRASKADFLVETSPVNYETGEPAITHIKAGLSSGMHAVSANKGPVVHAFRSLKMLAKENDKQFLFESAVMDGAPIFSVFREALPSLNVEGFEGILNSCTNLLLEKMEAGKSFEDAVAFAQSIGIAETDPSGDIDGWDAAVKVAALVTVMMDHPMTPQDVERKGIREITPDDIQKGLREGKRWKLVCSADKTNEGVAASVQPKLVASTSPLYAVNGTSSLVIFKTDILPGLGILESDPGPETTAYGLLADMLNILKVG